MTKDYESIKNSYIDTAILQSEASYNGDHKTANKQYKTLKKIYDQIEQKKISKELLLELLNHPNLAVKSWAASHMLGLKFETDKAEQELKNILSMPESGMIGFSAEMTLKVWKEQGYLKF